MLKRFKNSYYSKIMIVCIAAVCAITAILLPVCSSLIHQQERSEDLKKYDLILDRLTASMTSRQEALATNLTPFFSMRRIHKIYAVSIVPPAKKFLGNTVTVSWRCSVLSVFPTLIAAAPCS